MCLSYLCILYTCVHEQYGYLHRYLYIILNVCTIMCVVSSSTGSVQSCSSSMYTRKQTNIFYLHQVHVGSLQVCCAITMKCEKKLLKLIKTFVLLYIFILLLWYMLNMILVPGTLNKQLPLKVSFEHRVELCPWHGSWENDSLRLVFVLSWKSTSSGRWLTF